MATPWNGHQYSSPPSLAEAIRPTRLWLLTFGIVLFDNGNRITHDLAFVFRILHIFVTTCYFVHTINGGVWDKDDLETTLVIVFHGVVSLFCYISVQRQMRGINGTLSSLRVFLTDGDVKNLGRIETWSVLTFLVIIKAAGTAGAILINQDARMMIKTFRNFNIDPSRYDNRTLSLVGIVVFYIYGATVLAITSSVTMSIYFISLLVFRAFALRLLDDIRLTAYYMTEERLGEIRKNLRTFWSLKVQLDGHLSIFPFAWTTNVFVTMTILFTRVVVNFEYLRFHNPFTLVSVGLTFLFMAYFCIMFFFTETVDRVVDECTQAAFNLTDPRFRDLMLQNLGIRREITLLHHDLTNRPKTHSTIVGMARVSKKTLITLTGALINFSVMVINIRMAVKQCIPGGGSIPSTNHTRY